MFLKIALVVVLGVAIQNVYADELDSVDGGTPVSPGEMPYQVSVRINGKHFCGGAIYSNLHIITGARCISGHVSAPWSNLTVVTGSVDLNSGGQTHFITRYRIHPLFMNGGKWSWHHDIAILFLEQPMNFNEHQSSIPMATSDPEHDAEFTLSGWGRTESSYSGILSNKLQKATAHYVSNDQCRYGHRGMPMYDTFLCALHSNKRAHFHGDNGGPLVHNGHLVGISSWGGPYSMGVPDVYTRISKYHEFFDSIQDFC